MIIGDSGSGKSTLARRLGDVLGLPVVHMDCIHWQPGWINRTGEEKDKLCSAVHARDKWIFEGGRSITWPQRLDRADTLIYLDFSFHVRLWRVLKRRVKYHGRTRPDMPDECPERITWEFVQLIWKNRKTNRERLIKFFDAAPDAKDKYRLRGRLEVESFINNIDR